MPAGPETVVDLLAAGEGALARAAWPDALARFEAAAAADDGRRRGRA